MNDAVKKALSDYTPKDDREEYLVHIVLNFKPDDEKDDQMKELFEWGLNENAMWQE